MSEDPSGLGVGAPVPPRERPRKERRGSRVVVWSDDDRVLLTERFDPGLPESGWWTTPGGGIDPGEEPREAACRELWEETGRRVDPAELIGPLLTRVAVHGYSDQIARQQEWFFLWRVPAVFEVRPAVVTARERVSTRKSRWWPRAELASTDAWVWDPVEEVIAQSTRGAASPLDLGEVELSTVPADAD